MMGAGKEMICKTCKVAAYIGYGSYGGRPGGDTLADFERRNADRVQAEGKPYWGADAYRRFLAEHEGHDFLDWSEDYGCCAPEHHGGDLRMMGSYGSCGEVIVEGYTSYKQVDLSGQGAR